MNESDKLIRRYKTLEQKLKEKLMQVPKIYDDDENVLVNELKNYIKKMNEVKKVFDEYEKTAQEIGKIAFGKVLTDEQVAELANDLEEEKTESKPAGVEEYKDEVLVVDGKTTSVKKKKKVSTRSKEF